MEKHFHSSSRHISAECETQTEYGSLAAHTGGGTIDLYLKPLEAEQSSAPRQRNTTKGTSVAHQRHLPPSWESA